AFKSPASSLAMSSNWSVSWIILPVFFFIISNNLLSSAVTLSVSCSAGPSINESGVLNSCAMLEKKRVLTLSSLRSSFVSLDFNLISFLTICCLTLKLKNQAKAQIPIRRYNSIAHHVFHQGGVIFISNDFI